MRVDTRTFRRVLSILVLLDALAFALVFAPRPALTEDQWQFLERQRPTAHGGLVGGCADCLNFAVFRRGIGGWETFSAAALQLVNLPGFLLADKVFSELQRQPSGTSRQHSDLATIVLVTTATLECALAALVLSVRGRRGATGLTPPLPLGQLSISGR
jgi:hypothetical protein